METIHVLHLHHHCEPTFKVRSNLFHQSIYSPVVRDMVAVSGRGNSSTSAVPNWTPPDIERTLTNYSWLP